MQGSHADASVLINGNVSTEKPKVRVAQHDHVNAQHAQHIPGFPTVQASVDAIEASGWCETHSMLPGTSMMSVVR